MATKAQALRVASKFGFVLDETVSGKIGWFMLITFDHPTHSISGDCRSIHVEDTSASRAWEEAIERMNAEGPHLVKCNNSSCEYHGEEIF